VLLPVCKLPHLVTVYKKPVAQLGNASDTKLGVSLQADQKNAAIEFHLPTMRKMIKLLAAMASPAR
jgi:hypothetical protein